jgi:hypothetical protein
MVAQLIWRGHFVQRVNTTIIIYVLTILLFGFGSNSHHVSNGAVESRGGMGRLRHLLPKMK